MLSWTLLNLGSPWQGWILRCPFQRLGYDDKHLSKWWVTSLGPPCFVRLFENHILRYFKSCTLQSRFALKAGNHLTFFEQTNQSLSWAWVVFMMPWGTMAIETTKFNRGVLLLWLFFFGCFFLWRWGRPWVVQLMSFEFANRRWKRINMRSFNMMKKNISLPPSMRLSFPNK